MFVNLFAYQDEVKLMYANRIVYVYLRLKNNQKGKFVGSFTSHGNNNALAQARVKYPVDKFVCSYF